MTDEFWEEVAKAAESVGKGAVRRIDGGQDGTSFKVYAVPGLTRIDIAHIDTPTEKEPHNVRQSRA